MYTLVPGLSLLESVVAPKSSRVLLADAIVESDDDEATRIVTENIDLGNLDAQAMAKIGGLPLLHAACANNLGRTVSALLQRGANVEARWQGETPLHICARHDAGTAAQALLKAGARPWLEDYQGRDARSIAKRCSVLNAIRSIYAAEENDDYEISSTTSSADDVEMSQEEEDSRLPRTFESKDIGGEDNENDDDYDDDDENNDSGEDMAQEEYNQPAYDEEGEEKRAILESTRERGPMVVESSQVEEDLRLAHNFASVDKSEINPQSGDYEFVSKRAELDEFYARSLEVEEMTRTDTLFKTVNFMESNHHKNDDDEELNLIVSDSINTSAVPQTPENLRCTNNCDDNTTVATAILSIETTPNVSELVKENIRLRAQIAKLSTPQNSNINDSTRKKKPPVTTPKSHRLRSRERRVLSACAATARAVASPATQARRVREVMDALCKVQDEATLDRICARLEADSTLLLARAFGCAHAYDGATVLHAAAAKGQLQVVRRLLDLGLDPLSLDPYGRTALHVAAEGGHLPIVLVLKDAMAKANGGNIPLGKNAPVDMAGRTPVAWAADRVKNKEQRKALEEALFLKGDQAVLPTPKSEMKRPALYDDIQGTKPPLSVPEKKIVNSNLKVAAAQAPGFRVDMEDAHVVSQLEDENTLVAAVFDGHGGNLCAKLAAERLTSHLRKALFSTRSKLSAERKHSLNDMSTIALTNSILSLDAELSMHPRLSFKPAPTGRFSSTLSWRAEDTSGSTATIALFYKAKDKIDFTLAYLGDSRAALIEADTFTFLTGFHKPSESNESQRLAKYNSFQKDQGAANEDLPYIDDHGCLAVKRPATSLAMARALGDFLFKRRIDIDDKVDHSSAAVSAEPDIISMSRHADAPPAILILASDGLWDVLSPDEVRTILIENGLFPQQNLTNESVVPDDAFQCAVDALVAAAVTNNSRDNVTVILIDARIRNVNQSLTEKDNYILTTKSSDKDQDQLLKPTQLDFSTPID